MRGALLAPTGAALLPTASLHRARAVRGAHSRRRGRPPAPRRARDRLSRRPRARRRPVRRRRPQGLRHGGPHGARRRPRHEGARARRPRSEGGVRAPALPRRQSARCLDPGGGRCLAPRRKPARRQAPSPSPVGRSARRGGGAPRLGPLVARRDEPPGHAGILACAPHPPRAGCPACADLRPGLREGKGSRGGAPRASRRAPRTAAHRRGPPAASRRRNPSRVPNFSLRRCPPPPHASREPRPRNRSRRVGMVRRRLDALHGRRFRSSPRASSTSRSRRTVRCS